MAHFSVMKTCWLSVVATSGRGGYFPDALWQKSVTIVHRRDELRAQKVLQDRAFANERFALSGILWWKASMVMNVR